MKTPSILARSTLEGRLQFQVLQQVTVTNQPHCKCTGHLSLKMTKQRWRVFFLKKKKISCFQFLLTTFLVIPLPSTTEHCTHTTGCSGSLKHKSIINKTHLVFLHAEAHLQATETRHAGLLHLCTIQETDVRFTDRGTQQLFPLLLSDLFVTFVIANRSKQN